MLANVRNYEELIRDLPTKSEKIRVLARHGMATADIARLLDLRYQHVRNVLMQEKVKQQVVQPSSPRTVAWVEIDAQGRLQLPPDLMQSVGLKADDRVRVEIKDNGLEILSQKASLDRVHKIIRERVPKGVSLVDELFAERRWEFEKEEQESECYRSLIKND